MSAVAEPVDTPIAVRAGSLLDVERGHVLAQRVVLIRGKRIEAVQGPDDPVPEGARWIDLSDHTVLPGLIDCHTHLVGEIESAVPGPLLRSTAQEAYAGVRNARDTLLA